MLHADKERTRARDDAVYRAAYRVSEGLLADHVIGGRSILPGARMVDLALAAAHARQPPCLALREVVICRPGVARELRAVGRRWGNFAFDRQAGQNWLWLRR